MYDEPNIFELALVFILSWKFLAILVGIWLVTTSIVITGGKTAKIVERFGKPQELARTPGISLKLPWPIDNVVGIVHLNIQEIDANVSVKTKDNAFMTLPVKVQYRADDSPEGAVRAHYELEDPEKQITSYVLNGARQTASGMDMVELYANRSSVEEHVQGSLAEQFAKYGFVIENVLVDEPQPSDEVREAFNRVIASIRAKEAATNLAEAKRIELVGVATAEKESKKLQGEGMRAMREEIAKGLEEAIKKLSEVMTPEQALNLLMDTNRLDTLSSAAAHGNMILVDMHGGGNTDLAKTVAAVRAAGASPAPVPATTPAGTGDED